MESLRSNIKTEVRDMATRRTLVTFTNYQNAIPVVAVNVSRNRCGFVRPDIAISGVSLADVS